MPIVLTGSSVNVRGISNATPIVALSPGKAPNTMPITVPSSTTSRIDGSRNVARAPVNMVVKISIITPLNRKEGPKLVKAH